MVTKKICPNFTKGRGTKKVEIIVIHWFGIGTLSSANTRFQNKDAQASAHYGISNNTVYQWVEEQDTAWHAGVFDINQKSIGIEHDATTTKNMSEETYITSANLIREICQRHNLPIDREHIRGHKDFKATQCPGTIDIDKLISLAKQETMSDNPILKLIEENNLTEGQIRQAIGWFKENYVSVLENKNISLQGDIIELKNKILILEEQLKSKTSEELKVEPVEQTHVCSANLKDYSAFEIFKLFIKKLLVK